MPLGKRYQLIARSTPEVKAQWEDLLVWAKYHSKLSFRGSKPSQEVLLNGLVLWITGLPAPKREEILKAGLSLLDATALSGDKTEPQKATATDGEDLSDDRRGKKRA